MAYFPESVIITTIDGIQFKTFSNEHPDGHIIAKPKYIPIEEVFSPELPRRKIFNQEVNRFDLWINKKSLKEYIEAFCQSYPHYKYYSENHKNWFFAIPKNRIKKIYDPREGLKELMNIPGEEQDEHLTNVTNFVELILKSGVSLQDLGITFSTLVGHYDANYSDINLIIYGKKNAWNIINFLEKAKHPSLRWKTKEEWEEFRQKRNRANIFTKEEFAEQMSRKRTEGFFEDTLFVLFPVEKKDEIKNNWDDETCIPLGLAEIEGRVIDNSDSIFRPGTFKIKEPKTIKGEAQPVSQVVFYSRDYVAQVLPEEKISAAGLLERVTNKKTKKESYRIVVGYFDSYLNERREQEYIKKIN